MLDRNFNDVVGLGVSRIEVRKGLERDDPADNVIKVDFGEKQ